MKITITSIYFHYAIEALTDGFGKMCSSTSQIEGYTVGFTLNDTIESCIVIKTNEKMEIKDITQYIENKIKIEKG